MKVKILANNYMTELERKINNFIKDKEIISVSYSDAYSNDGLLGTYSAMILYKEED